MGPDTDLNLFKEKAAAVQVVISEISDVAAALDYAADLTTKQGGKCHGRLRLGRSRPGNPGESLLPSRGEPGCG